MYQVGWLLRLQESRAAIWIWILSFSLESLPLQSSWGLMIPCCRMKQPAKHISIYAQNFASISHHNLYAVAMTFKIQQYSPEKKQMVNQQTLCYTYQYDLDVCESALYLYQQCVVSAFNPEAYNLRFHLWFPVWWFVSKQESRRPHATSEGMQGVWEFGFFSWMSEIRKFLYPTLLNARLSKFIKSIDPYGDRSNPSTDNHEQTSGF